METGEVPATKEMRRLESSFALRSKWEARFAAAWLRKV